MEIGKWKKGKQIGNGKLDNGKLPIERDYQQKEEAHRMGEI